MPQKKSKLPLSKTHPKIAKQAFRWDPSVVFAGSGKKYEWQCSKMHVWSESCNNRTSPNRSKNAGCPYCTNKKVLSGFNDLKTLYPELAKEADGWDTTKILPGTHKKLKWKCKHGHKWNAEVRTRAIRGLGCSFCSGQRAIKGTTDLQSTHPKIAKQAFGWDPSMVKRGTNKKLKWKCDLGHIWIASPAERLVGTRSGNPNGCPFCSGQRVLKGFNDLATTHPKIAQQAHKWNPTTVSSGTHQVKKWQCEKGHIWKAAVYARKVSGCPYCSGRVAVKGKTDLKTLNSKLAKELVDADPSGITFSSGKTYKWKCKQGHIFLAQVSSRTRTGAGTGCPTCNGRKVLKGFNDLATTHPNLAKEAFGWDPSTVTAGNGIKRKWKCKLGHTWINSPNSRTSAVAKSGKPLACPVCSGQKLLSGFNDLLTTHPSVAQLAYKWDPTKVQAGSHGKKLWKCKLGHITSTEISNKVSRQLGPNCSICSNSELLEGFNDMATTFPELALQANGWDPKKVVAGTNRRLSWKCNLGHIWVTSGNNRTMGNDCPVCANKVILVGFNDLFTTYPKIAAEMVNGDPKTVTAGSGKIFKWRCEIGHTWNAQVANRVYGTGCPSCAVGGFNPNIDGWLYLIWNENYQMLQIGISNYPEDRLKVHQRNDWELIELRGPMQGDVAYAWEQSIMKMLKYSGANLGDATIDGKFEGFTEAWSQAKFPVSTIKELMQLTEQFEDGKSVTNLLHRKTKKD
jgi:hypothetical protein